MADHARSLSELEEDAPGYLEEFTDPTLNFAFRTYDNAPVQKGPLHAGDVLMANLLSLRLGWRDVVPLFADGTSPHIQLRRALDEALTACRELPALEDCNDEQLEMPALKRANELTESVENWTPVTVSKVLHRLAPVVPLIDSRIKTFFATSWPRTIRFQLRDDLKSNIKWLKPLAQRHTVRGGPMPLNRVADIAIWMERRQKGAALNGM